MSDPTPIRVLVADDHLVVRRGLVSLIDDEADMQVVGEAQNGAQAVTLFRQLQPDVTLMDLRMPELSGSDAITAIRQDTPTARIVILTTYDSDDDIYTGLRAGAMAYLLKDSPRQELILAMRSVLAGKRYLPSLIGTKLAEWIDTAQISNRERQVLYLMASGRSNRAIGESLGIAEGTVKSHVNNIMNKLQADDRTHAVVVALKRGIIKL